MSPQPVSRRAFLGTAGAAGTATIAALVAAEGTSTAAARAAAAATAPSAFDAAVPFEGAHQAGIVTPVQDRLLFASFDVITDDRDDLVQVLEDWTAASRRMVHGEMIGTDNDNQDAPPGRHRRGRRARAGVAHAHVRVRRVVVRPPRRPVPHRGAQARGARADAAASLATRSVPSISDGDIAIQSCANDPTVAFHAIRDLARIGRGVVALRWSQQGFGRTSVTDAKQTTPRNLMGFKDGTNNIVVEDTGALDDHVWVAAKDDPAWMRNGSYLVTRRIRMMLEIWDRSTLADQELTIGRNKQEGAPLGGAKEHDTVNLTAKQDGEPVIPVDAHIRLAAPEQNDGVRLLRRGFSFTDGIDPVTNQLDAGLFFIAYQRDPRTGFIPVQQNLAADALNEYIRHDSTATFACPPGVGPDGFVGETLFN